LNKKARKIRFLVENHPRRNWGFRKLGFRKHCERKRNISFHVKNECSLVCSIPLMLSIFFELIANNIVTAKWDCYNNEKNNQYYYVIS